MGMDVFGLNPKNKVGEYFRNNVWWWHPLWDYCCDVDPSLIDKVPNAHSNDGDGLTECSDCDELADKLDVTLSNGYAEFYIAQRDIELSNKPLIECNICNGTGQRPDGLFGIEWKKEGCNACDGKGYHKDFETNYQINIENIKEFINFLRNCGGFKIC